MTEIRPQLWLNEEEEPHNEVWRDLDTILSNDDFELLTRVEVGCVWMDDSQNWHFIDKFDRSEFPALLPGLFKKGVLIW